MKPKTVAVIKVLYSFDHGHHIFTSDDLDGLLVVSEDAETVYRQLVPSIKKLLKIKTGIEFQIESAMSLKNFMSHVVQNDFIEEEPPVLSDKEFCLTPA